MICGWSVKGGKGLDCSGILVFDLEKNVYSILIQMKKMHIGKMVIQQDHNTGIVFEKYLVKMHIYKSY